MKRTIFAEITTLTLDKCTLKTRLMQQTNSIYFAHIPSSNHYLFHHKNDQWSHFYCSFLANMLENIR